ncbi:Na/Pi-cotransporter II-related protein [Thiorhodococcus drewsii AZ1]|uniref:Na/Pi-cotransporter II-related protein n=1 Tax=Thiorhodococcus drewsii AZ1 TaxID=765913 RepID=G2DXE0_9GAMM|nr:Na/Pi cotransporter family protein [Thiorhodococcus drewsii]EGV33172.1 Na/Pi-cotransporter II-related protein [Thiorhodococcus drewsii AZ1]
MSRTTFSIAPGRAPLGRWGLMVALSMVGIMSAASAADDLSGTNSIDWTFMGMGLFGGLALFLSGMDQMATALTAVAGERMKGILAKLTTNRFMGALTGAFVTAIINSSSVTTVLVVGFISAGLMSLAQSVGVIMGANIGSTVTAQLIAFRIDQAALLMIGIGFAMPFASKRESARHYGSMIMGLGLIFFGMTVMSDAMAPLRTYQPFLDFMTTLERPVVGILVAAVFTGLIQSSAATTGIAIVMASQGFLTLPAGIALAFGANIGTCVTAMLASIGKPREAVRAALVHVIFNVAGVIIWFGLIDQLALFVQWISPAYPELSGSARLAAEVPRQIANAHSIFNLANTVIFIGLTGQFARLAEWLIPDKPLGEQTFIVQAKYLDEELLTTPSLALDRVRLEILHMGESVQTMMRRIMPAILSEDRQALREIELLDNDVDTLHAQIIAYLGQISRSTLTERQTHELLRLLDAANDLENIGDLIETDLVDRGRELIDTDVSISEPTREVLLGLHRTVSRALAAALQAVAQNNEIAARTVTSMKQEITQIAESAAAHEARRLVAEEPNRIPAYTLEIDILEKLKRIFYFAKRMAKTVDGDEMGNEAA